jgi:hypothetical protein
VVPRDFVNRSQGHRGRCPPSLPTWRETTSPYSLATPAPSVPPGLGTVQRDVGRFGSPFPCSLNGAQRSRKLVDCVDNRSRSRNDHGSGLLVEPPVHGIGVVRHEECEDAANTQ